jgi:N-methylhydantoinase B
MQTDVLDILMRNTRLPMSAEGDLNGQLGALDLGIRRLDALLDEYGPETVQEALAALGDRAETLLRQEVAALPDGRWEAEDFLDNDGIDPGELPIRVALEIEGDRLRLDFAGTAGGVLGPINIARPTTIACVYVAIKHLFPGLPANAGVLRPIDIAIPGDCLLSAEFPTPTGGYTETILRMIDVIFAAAAQAAPERAIANAYGTINALSIAGKRRDGRRWVMFSFYGGGHGATRDSDGLNHGNAPISMATIPPVEILEAAYPVAFRQWALRPGSAGAGAHRGGLGAVYEIEVLEEMGAEAFFFGERGRFSPKGVAGGGDAARNHFTFQQGDGWDTPPLVSKMVGIKLKQGERVRLETPGGGGYGPTSERPARAVARDVALGYLGAEEADAAYGLAWREAGA